MADDTWEMTDGDEADGGRALCRGGGRGGAAEMSVRGCLRTEVELVGLRAEVLPEGRQSQTEPMGWRHGAQQMACKSMAQAG